MNILITHAFSLEQKGDSALLAGTIAQLRLAFPKAKLSAQIMARTKPGETYKHTPVMESVIYTATVPNVSKPVLLMRMGYVLVVAYLWAFLLKRTGKSFRLGMPRPLYASCQAIARADAVVPVAGGYLAGAPGIGETLNLLLIVLPLWLAHILGKPVVHFSQSVGPFASRLQRAIVQAPLRRARLVITRESVSTKFAQSLGVAPGHIIQSIDVGFLFEPEPNYQLASALDDPVRRDTTKPLVGLTTKKHLAVGPQASYERELAAFADWLCHERGMQVVFIPQVTSPELGHDDRIINRRIFALMQHTSQAFLIEQNLTNHETKSVIDQVDYLIGTRFHSVIFALTGYVPAIGLEYEHKTSGILFDLDLPHWMLQMRGLRALDLEILFDELVEGRQAYLKHLKTVLPPYLAKAAGARERMQLVLAD